MAIDKSVAISQLLTQFSWIIYSFYDFTFPYDYDFTFLYDGTTILTIFLRLSLRKTIHQFSYKAFRPVNFFSEEYPRFRKSACTS